MNNRYNPTNLLKFYTKKGISDLKFASFPINGTPYVYESWGKNELEAKKALFRGLIDNKF